MTTDQRKQERNAYWRSRDGLGPKQRRDAKPEFVGWGQMTIEERKTAARAYRKRMYRERNPYRRSRTGRTFAPELVGWGQMTTEQRKAAARAYRKRIYQERNGKEKSRAYARLRAGAIATRPEPATCEGCGQPPSGKRPTLHLDHDHATGRFRGWLCRYCNAALGYVRDNPLILQALIEYLARP